MPHETSTDELCDRAHAVAAVEWARMCLTQTVSGELVTDIVPRPAQVNHRKLSYRLGRGLRLVDVPQMTKLEDIVRLAFANNVEPVSVSRERVCALATDVQADTMSTECSHY